MGNDKIRLQEVRRLLTRMDITPAPHDKKCWFCAQCGDDLQAIIKLVDAELDEDYRKGAKP